MIDKPALHEAEPLISIGLPVRNAATTIGDAIASILAQTYTRWELIIADDGSTDGTRRAIERFGDARIRVLADGRHRGLPARLNQCVDAAQGSLFARMDGDDWSYPERLARQLAYLHAHPDVDVVAAGLLVVTTDGRVDGRDKPRGTVHDEITRTPWRGFHFNHATWLGHVGWFRHHRYCETARRMEDDDLLLRAYRQSCFARLPDILYGYRVDTLSLRKILVARQGFVRLLIRQAAQQRDARLLLGVVPQLLKAAVDVAAVGSGLGYALLPHRAAPVADEERRRWDAVRDQIEACRQDALLRTALRNTEMRHRATPVAASQPLL